MTSNNFYSIDNIFETTIKFVEKQQMPEFKHINAFLYTSELDKFFEYALAKNSIKVVLIMLDHFNVPDYNMSLKQRISYYYLLKE